MATAARQLAPSANLTYVPQDHEPVLAEELVELLDPRPGETFVDCTFGGGGHARLIAERLGADGELIAVDRDPSSEARWREFAATAPSRARFLRANFVVALEGLRGEGVRPDGILFDLGMSSLQLDAWERGFSYAFDAPLDMRMDPDQELTAAEIVNEWQQDRLARVLREFGEERRAGSIAREIVRRRPLTTTSELVAAVKAAIPPAERFGRGHPAKRSFQAIRIAVNDELGALDRALPLAWQLLPVGGRLGAISFHSLEDRRVKRFLADRARGCVCPPELPVCVCGREPEAELLSRRAIAPTPEEIERNPRAASAHLRAARKLRDQEERADGESRPRLRRSQRPAAPPNDPAHERPPRTRTARRTSAQAKARPRRRTRPQDRPAAPRTAVAPDQRPASARRVVQPAFAGAAAGAAMLPGAALRSAVAVRDLSDSGLIMRLTRGRGWIAVLCVLLFGIVALNVVSLSLNAGSGRVSQAVEEVERQNSALRAQLAEQLSASRIEGAAAMQGWRSRPRRTSAT